MTTIGGKPFPSEDSAREFCRNAGIDYREGMDIAVRRVDLAASLLPVKRRLELAAWPSPFIVPYSPYIYAAYEATGAGPAADDRDAAIARRNAPETRADERRGG